MTEPVPEAHGIQRPTDDAVREAVDVLARAILWRLRDEGVAGANIPDVLADSCLYDVGEPELGALEARLALLAGDPDCRPE